MENYGKGEIHEVAGNSEFPVSLNNTVIRMRVNYGSKIRNLMGYAVKKIKDPGVTGIYWEGSGNAISKTVTCAEVTKRRIQGLHQINHIRYKRLEELWEPKLEGLDRLKVNRNIPVLAILLSKTPLNDIQPGYQCQASERSFFGTSTTKRNSESGQTNKRKGPAKTKTDNNSTKSAKSFKSRKRPVQNETPKTQQHSENSTVK